MGARGPGGTSHRRRAYPDRTFLNNPRQHSANSSLLLVQYLLSAIGCDPFFPLPPPALYVA